MTKRLAAFAAVLLALVVVPAMASAHPIETGEVAVPWTDDFSRQQAVKLTRGTPPLAEAAQAAPPGISGLELVGNSDKDGTTNSDLAFWGNLVYAGNYSGFRILDARTDAPRVVADVACNGPQNDVSVHEMGGRRYLFQSVDTAQTTEDCTSANAPIGADGSRVGYEGVRVFDVTNPAAPRFIDMIQTACGSHTHTLIPGDSRRGDDDDDDDDRRGRASRGGGRDDDKAYIYVASYPLGSNITGPTGPGDFKPCAMPHKKLTIIEVESKRGQFSHRLREQELSDDTAITPVYGFQACHDFQAFMAKDVMVASCAGDAQLWDISDPWRPSTDTPGRHTHITSPSATDSFEFIHSGVVNWDGDVFAIMDETGGGGTAECDGSATTDGFYYFYEMVKPGKRAPRLLGRYTIPRAQSPEICVSHNATVIPIESRDIMTTAYYQGGVTVVDFSDPRRPREVAYADLADGTGISDEWSSYWYNGRVFSNSGLGRRGPTANRGVDVFRPTGWLASVTRKAERWAYSNPQTQEAWQRP